MLTVNSGFAFGFGLVFGGALALAIIGYGTAALRDLIKGR